MLPCDLETKELNTRTSYLCSSLLWLTHTSTPLWGGGDGRDEGRKGPPPPQGRFTSTAEPRGHSCLSKRSSLCLLVQAAAQRPWLLPPFPPVPGKSSGVPFGRSLTDHLPRRWPFPSACPLGHTGVMGVCRLEQEGLEERSWCPELPRQGEGWGSELGSKVSVKCRRALPASSACGLHGPSALGPGLGLGRVTHAGREAVCRGLCPPRLPPSASGREHAWARLWVRETWVWGRTLREHTGQRPKAPGGPHRESRAGDPGREGTGPGAQGPRAG